MSGAGTLGDADAVAVAVTRPAVHRGRHAEVYVTRSDSGDLAALKLATDEAGAAAVRSETETLARLRTAQIPQPLGDGEHNGQPYLLTSWVYGIDARSAAIELRDTSDRQGLMALCAGATVALSEVHAAGLVHGQVHPRHFRVDSRTGVHLIDLSTARSPGGTARLTSLSAPEQARQILRGEPMTEGTAAEQFSLAALLYLLVSGSMYAPLRLSRETLPTDIARAELLPFTAHGARAWPELERSLHRALSSAPEARYGSVSEFAAVLAELAADRPVARRAGWPTGGSHWLTDFQQRAMATAGAGAIPPPRCSINYGAAGIAYAWSRLSQLADDPGALVEAERWLNSAQAYRRTDGYEHGEKLSAKVLGPISPFHRPSGIPVVAAAIARGRGDVTGHQAAVDAYVAMTTADSPQLDLTLGWGAVLLVGAILLSEADPSWEASGRLREHGDVISARIAEGLAARSPVYNGIAHGWAGIAYALMMWAAARGSAPPPVVEPILGRLAGEMRPEGRGCRWPVRPTKPGADDVSWPGWCHGHAGYVFLWNRAASFTSDPLHHELAERAAWMTADQPAPIISLCCGVAGQTYALLNQYRSSGERHWLAKAHAAAGRAAGGDLDHDAVSDLSLYKGVAAMALVTAELERPERSAMPLFEF